jgi:hypothetical protein
LNETEAKRTGIIAVRTQVEAARVMAEIHLAAETVAQLARELPSLLFDAISDGRKYAVQIEPPVVHSSGGMMEFVLNAVVLLSDSSQSQIGEYVDIRDNNIAFELTITDGSGKSRTFAHDDIGWQRIA